MLEDFWGISKTKRKPRDYCIKRSEDGNMQIMAQVLRFFALVTLV